MSVEHVEFLVEEPSMAEFLHGLLPRLLGRVTFAVHPSQCKSDLLQNLPRRLRGYKQWMPPTWRIVVLVDRDDEDCAALKRTLEQAAEEAGLATRTAAGKGRFMVANRIVIEELEAWYFGDWKAVRQAYPRAPVRTPRQAAYRQPDDIAGGTWEAFERVMQKAGYFAGGLQKIEAARTIAPYMDPARSRSPSFRALADVLKEMVEP